MCKQPLKKQIAQPWFFYSQRWIRDYGILPSVDDLTLIAQVMFIFLPGGGFCH